MFPETECGRVPPAAWMTTLRGTVRFLLLFRIQILKRVAGPIEAFYPIFT